MPFLPLALAAGSIGASALGGRAAKKGIKRAQGRVKDVPVPTAQALQPRFQRLQGVGEYRPQFAQETLAPESLVGQGPQLGREAQLRALAGLGRIADDGGLAAEDRAALAGVTRDVATQERGQREALAAGARRQGQGGSGLDLVRQQIAQQSAADRAAQEALDVAGLASQRRQQALAGLGSLGGQLSSDDARRAQAQDAINRFNTEALMAVRGGNIAAANQAAQLNLGEAQRLSDTNTGLANREEQARVDIPMQRYNLLLNRAGLLGGFDQQNAGANQQMFGALAQLLGRGAGGLGGGF